MSAATDLSHLGITDMESFFRLAKYPLVKFTDMTSEMREEAMDICITAVEKYPSDMEKCTQVGGGLRPARPGSRTTASLPPLVHEKAQWPWLVGLVRDVV
jgi:hypothetical protein